MNPSSNNQLEDIFSDIDNTPAQEVKRAGLGVLPTPPKQSYAEPRVIERLPDQPKAPLTVPTVSNRPFYKRPAVLLLLIMVGLVLLTTAALVIYGLVSKYSSQKNVNINYGNQNINKVFTSNVNAAVIPVNTNNVVNTNVGVQNTNTAYWDTDRDGLTDAEETEKYGTDPKKFDTDGDDLTDREEVKVYLTDALKKDTDGDGYNDGDEIKKGYNPNGPGKLYDLDKAINELNNTNTN